MTHECSVLTGEKMVVTSLPDEPGRIGWILPCEAFKGRPRILGFHCPNVDDIELSDAVNTPYFQMAKNLMEIWKNTFRLHGEVCFGQWLSAITNKQGFII